MRFANSEDARQEFERAIRIHVPELFHCAFAISGDRRCAEAAVLATSTRARECLAESDATPQGRSWIFGLLLDELRNRPGRRASLLRLIRRAGEDQILRAVRQLPAEYAEVIVLVDVHGFHYDEAAEALGVTRNIVLDRVRAARSELRSMLQPGLGSTANSPQASQRLARGAV